MDDNLREFPDGGRATVARRFMPPLTRHQFSMLDMCPYEKPGCLTSISRAARELVRLGLLEEDPQTRGWFRVTSIGADVVARWRNAGWR